MAEEKLEQVDSERKVLERILSLKQFIKEEPQPQDYHELGICYFHLANYDQSIKYFDDLIEKFPKYIDIASVYSIQIYSKIQLQDFLESLELIKKRLEFYPADTRLLGMQAHCFQQLGKSSEAIQVHEHIVEIEPDNINSLNSLGFLLTLKQEPSLYPKAFAYLKKALELKPNHPAYLDSLGVLLLNQGNLKSSGVALKRALLGMPNNSEILDHLSDLMNLQK